MDGALDPRRSSGDVMASIDDGSEEERLIIADVSRDEAWIAMTMLDAPSLARWR